MTRPTRILIVEDSVPDYLLTLRALEQEGWVPETKRVDRLGDLREALQEQTWDAVVSDYSLPGMPFREVLATVQAENPELPVLIFSGSVGEEEAVDLLKAGVRDFILKDRPGRLPKALQNALMEAQSQRAQREAMKALAASEARFLATFEQAAIGMAQVGLDGRVIKVNQRLCEILGYPQEELLGLTSQDLSPAAEAARTWAQIRRLMEGGASTFTEEKRNIRKDGSIVWVSLSVSLVRTPQGEPDYLVCVVEDIQRRKDAEKELKDSETLLGGIMDSIGPMLTVVNREGVIIHINKSWNQFFSSQVPAETPAPGIGSNFFARIGSCMPREKGLQVVETLQAILASGEGHFEMECAWGDRWFHMAATPLTGGLEGLVIIHTEITARRQADAALKASEERFFAIFQASPIATLLTDSADETILDANPAFLQMSGRELQAVLGHTTRELAFWVDLQERVSALDRIRTTGRLRNFEMSFRQASGVPGHAVVSAETAHLGGRPVMVSLYRDVTEIRNAQEKEHQLEQELAHLQRLESVGRLAGGVSHDMNNVLCAILNMAELMKLECAATPDLARKTDIIVQAAARGRDLVKGLTDFARKDVQNALPVDLNLLVEREGELLEHTTFKRVEIQLDLAKPLPEIMGEANALANVLMNLCVNACDAMPSGGQLRLTTRLPRPDWVELIVQDTGEGMPPEIVSRAMEPFFTTKPSGKGTGLGLSIVYGTVKAHGGTVDIQSAPGRGTRITLGFPTLEKAPRAESSPAELRSYPDNSLKILVVDDDDMVRNTMVTLLEMLGHRVESASGGLEALRRLDAGLSVELVILDLNMPGLNGLDTLSRLRIGHPDLPILVSTGFLAPAEEEALKGFPGVRLLHKPFSLDEFRRLLAL
ncbi:MAG: multi-sensor hybrid histidine kinase [Holophagaceae bacterium]|nr:multi-sensor hybrid histidine kinase [Holophagaceae bacterium]